MHTGTLTMAGLNKVTILPMVNLNKQSQAHTYVELTVKSHRDRHTQEGTHESFT